VKGVTISSEVPGTVSAIRFESGQTVKQGQVLFELDTAVERAQLASAEARRDFALVNVGRSRSLVGNAAAPQAQLDADEAAVKTTSRDVEAVAAQIARKTTRAPFAGRLGLRSVNLGQYLNPGAPVTTLEAIDAVYVDFTIPQHRLSDVAVGMPVRVTVEGAGPAVDGSVGAVDPTIDATTRTIKVRAAVPNKGEALRPGMFARVELVLASRAPVVVVPQTAVVHASYGDSVFVLEDKADGAPEAGGKPVKKARQQFVRTGEARGDFVAVLEGVKAGDRLVGVGAFKLRNGAAVVVDDAAALAPSLAPRLDNR
jgi:membrane fusion protein (multidrug efflux system)